MRSGNGAFTREDDWFKLLKTKLVIKEHIIVNWFKYANSNPKKYFDPFGYYDFFACDQCHDNCESYRNDRLAQSKEECKDAGSIICPLICIGAGPLAYSWCVEDCYKIEIEQCEYEAIVGSPGEYGINDEVQECHNDCDRTPGCKAVMCEL
ncbi:MAG TPA: hypothetical protein DC049_05230 [Spirochaetia bacterium]|nr:hypothetical protein [Spirochaetia bacterium]